MLPEVVVRSEVQADLTDAYDWYEQQRSGLGTQFLDEVSAAIERIRANPTGYAEVHHRLRRAVSRCFPYGIFYQNEPGRVIVVAVLYLSRDPQLWRERA